MRKFMNEIGSWLCHNGPYYGPTNLNRTTSYRSMPTVEKTKE
jgi:hypothetical protein